MEEALSRKSASQRLFRQEARSSAPESSAPESSAPEASTPKSSAPKSSAPEPGATPPMFDLIELLFFAYRDFVADADRLLLRYNFGRAHHRVLHFVYRRPGLSVAELLDLLKITKQSLSRVLKDLLDQNYIDQRPGRADRRQRLLFASARGHDLALELAELQSRRFARALDKLPEGAREHAVAFLSAMCDASMCDAGMGEAGVSHSAGEAL